MLFARRLIHFKKHKMLHPIFIDTPQALTLPTPKRRAMHGLKILVAGCIVLSGGVLVKKIESKTQANPSFAQQQLLSATINTTNPLPQAAQGTNAYQIHIDGN